MKKIDRLKPFLVLSVLALFLPASAAQAQPAPCDDGITDTCVQVCRSAGYWSTHSGSEKDGVNVGQSVLDQVGPLEICGQSIDTTSPGSLSSALEALCVKIKGVKERQLYRQLVAAALNCSISEGGDCDEILARFVDVSFTDCNALCAGDLVGEEPTLSECKQQLGCFNKGGRLVEGECALGTCASQPEINCGAAWGDCPLFEDAPQECVRFEGNCHDSSICNTELDEAPAQICPESGRASSPQACKEARQNECTIDDCNPE